MRSNLQGNEVRVEAEYACLEPFGGGLVGRVMECGEAATAWQDARVLVSPLIACGECHTCRAGAATVCPDRKILETDRDGAYGKSVVCAGRWLTRLGAWTPDHSAEGTPHPHSAKQGTTNFQKGPLELDGTIAALVAGPALRAYGLFCRAGVAGGDVVIVLGRSPVAGILAKLATARGCKVVEGRSSAADIDAKLVELDCQSRPQKLFVCDGEANLALAMQVAQPASIIASGVGTGELDAAVVYENGLSVFGQEFAHPDLLPELAALVVKKELDLGSFPVLVALSPENQLQSQHAFEQGKCLVTQF